MSKNRTCWRLTPWVLVAGLACVHAASPHTYRLPDHGTLTLAVPDGWSAQFRPAPDRQPPTIILEPGTGTKFEVLITPVWPIGPTSGRIDEATLQSDVAAAAKSAESQSVEQSLPLIPISGRSGRGYYFFATDRAPKPGEFKYLTQGMIRTGDIALAFTILTNDGQQAAAKQALEAVRLAQQGPDSAAE